MSTSTEQLVRHLADAELGGPAHTELVRRGRVVVPVLVQAATHPQTPLQEAAILRTLLAINDPGTQDIFRRAVSSGDPVIRSIGAQGLHRLGAADALAALQLTINDAPDPLRFVQTPAVQSLIETGMAALPTVFTLMESSEEPTRRRAEHALAVIVLRDIVQQLLPRPLTNDAQAAWESLRQANGSYRWDAPLSVRQASLTLWRHWLRETP